MFHLHETTTSFPSRSDYAGFPHAYYAKASAALLPEMPQGIHS